MSILETNRLEQRQVCPDCGNNPVPHFLHWYFESLNVWLTGFRQLLLYNPLSRGIRKVGFWLNMPWLMVRLGRRLKIVTSQNDVASCKVKRAQVLWQEANKRGIEFQELKLFGRPFDTYVAKQGKKVLVFSGLPRPQGYNPLALDVLDDKAVFKAKFQTAGLPVPPGGSVYSFRQARQIFEDIRPPVVVKPRTGSRGRHSTTYVNTLDDLKVAFDAAKKLCFWVIVEKHLKGPVYRATVVNFEPVGVLRGDPPAVKGDGSHNLVELIRLKNLKPQPGVGEIVIDDKMERFLKRRGLSFWSVPSQDELVDLSEKIGVTYGGSSSEEFENCHPENKALFVKAARIVGDPIVGFDFIIPDITQSYRHQECGFIEANSLPFINLHHDPLHGRPRNVAAKVWDMMQM